MTCCCFTVCKRENFTGLPSKQLLVQCEEDQAAKKHKGTTRPSTFS